MSDEQIAEVAEWLRDIGYGFDFSAPDHPLPEFLRVPLAEAWRDASGDPSVSVDDWIWSLTIEGAFGDPAICDPQERTR